MGLTLSLSLPLSFSSFCPQALLRTLTYHTSADEPPSSPRTLTITTTSLTDQASCSVMITISLVNDHPSVIDLNGPSSPSINHSVSLSYSFFHPTRASVVAEDVTISDPDEDGVVSSLLVELRPGRPQDRLVLSDTLCPDNQESVCHLRFL